MSSQSTQKDARYAPLPFIVEPTGGHLSTLWYRSRPTNPRNTIALALAEWIDDLPANPSLDQVLHLANYELEAQDCTWCTDRIHTTAGLQTLHSCELLVRLHKDRAFQDGNYDIVDDLMGQLAGDCDQCNSLLAQYPVAPTENDYHFPPGVQEWTRVRVSASAFPEESSINGLIEIKWRPSVSSDGQSAVHVSWDSRKYNPTGWELWLFTSRECPPAHRAFLGSGFRGRLTLTEGELGFDPTELVLAYAIMPHLPDQ